MEESEAVSTEDPAVVIVDLSGAKETVQLKETESSGETTVADKSDLELPFYRVCNY